MLRLFSFVGLIIWTLFGISALVSSLPTAVDQPQNQQSETPQKYQPTLEVGVVEKVGALIHRNSEDITAVATVLLGYITFMLVRLGREQSSTTRAQLRAYVLVSGGKISGSAESKKRKAIISIRNFGQTPASDVKFAMGVGARPWPLDRELPIASDKVGGGQETLAPPQTICYGSRCTSFDAYRRNRDQSKSWRDLYLGRNHIYRRLR